MCLLLGIAGFFPGNAASDTAPSSPTQLIQGQDDATTEAAHPTDADTLTIAEISIDARLYSARVNDLSEKVQQAQEAGADILLLSFGDYESGSYEHTLRLMRTVRDFSGRTIAWIPQEAIGAAGALALTADCLYSAPNAVIGDLSASDSEQGIAELSNTYQARIRAEIPPNVPFRSEVARAMMDPEYVLEIDGEVLKNKGDYLVLTGNEAARTYPVDQQQRAPLLVTATLAKRTDVLERITQGKPYQLLDMAAADTSAEAPAEVALTPPTSNEADVQSPDPTEPAKADGSPHSVYVVEISGPIDSPQLFILRRALKEAIENNIDTIVLNMDTPGGALGTTLDMMEALQKFEGQTVTFVNSDAISAGSYIAIATDDIYFAPGGVMGAAEAVAGSGQDIPEAMNRKITSVMQAKIRAVSDEYRYRADVQRAMMDPDFVLRIEGEILKPEGELLTLTADEAVKEYGYPPQPLLAAGIAQDINDLLDQKYGAGNYTVKDFQLTWSEEFAKWFKMISPLLLGLGLLLIYFEAQTPGFGVFGIAGIVLLALFFSSNYVAGLAGYEAIILFSVGLILLGVEIFVFPGTLVFALSGLALMVGGLIWAMVDVWPGDAFELSPSMFLDPLYNFALGIVIATVGAVLFARFLPKRLFWDKIILAHQSASAPGSVTTGIGDVTPGTPVQLPQPGTKGITVSDLHPTGEVDIDGKRYQARARHGSINRKTPITVYARKDYFLVVEPES